jgi:thiaminase
MQDLHDTPEYREIIAYYKAMDFRQKEIYASWLAQSYYYVTHSTRLLAMAGSRFPLEHPIGQRMFEHVGEERGHEILAVRDVEALGFSLTDFPRQRMTEIFFQNQYYRIMFERASDFLGYVYLLEGIGVDIGDWLHEIVRVAHGPQASVFVKVHAHADKDHIVKAWNSILSLGPDEQQGVIDSFYQSCAMYSLMLKSMHQMGLEKIAA